MMKLQISSVKNSRNSSSSDVGNGAVGPTGCVKGAMTTGNSVLLHDVVLLGACCGCDGSTCDLGTLAAGVDLTSVVVVTNTCDLGVARVGLTVVVDTGAGEGAHGVFVGVNAE